MAKRTTACPTCGAFTMRGSRGTGQTFKVCADPCHGPLSEPYASDPSRTFGPVSSPPSGAVGGESDWGVSIYRAHGERLVWAGGSYDEATLARALRWFADTQINASAPSVEGESWTLWICPRHGPTHNTRRIGDGPTVCLRPVDAKYTSCGERCAKGTVVPRVLLDKERERTRELDAALERIDRLQCRWDAPLRHKIGDEGEARWAAVGSEAHKIAREALSRFGSVRASGEGQ